MKRIDSKMAQKMFLLWLVALIVFAAPHPLWGYIWDPIMHRPAFLIVAPLLLACIPLLFPLQEKAVICPPVYGGQARPRLWGNLVVGVACVLFLLVTLIALNDPSTPHKGGKNLGLNLSLIFLLILILVGIWKTIRLLRR